MRRARQLLREKTGRRCVSSRSQRSQSPASTSARCAGKAASSAASGIATQSVTSSAIPPSDVVMDAIMQAPVSGLGSSLPHAAQIAASTVEPVNPTQTQRHTPGNATQEQRSASQSSPMVVESNQMQPWWARMTSTLASSESPTLDPPSRWWKPNASTSDIRLLEAENGSNAPMATGTETGIGTGTSAGASPVPVGDGRQGKSGVAATNEHAAPPTPALAQTASTDAAETSVLTPPKSDVRQPLPQSSSSLRAIAKGRIFTPGDRYLLRLRTGCTVPMLVVMRLQEVILRLSKPQDCLMLPSIGSELLTVVEGVTKPIGYLLPGMELSRAIIGDSSALVGAIVRRRVRLQNFDHWLPLDRGIAELPIVVAATGAELVLLVQPSAKTDLVFCCAPQTRVRILNKKASTCLRDRLGIVECVREDGLSMIHFDGTEGAMAVDLRTPLVVTRVQATCVPEHL